MVIPVTEAPLRSKGTRSGSLCFSESKTRSLEFMIYLLKTLQLSKKMIFKSKQNNFSM
jgi:hypothetical protein